MKGLLPVNLLPHERNTFYKHLAAVFFDGIALSILFLNDYVAKTILNATSAEITIVTMIMPVTSFFSIYWGHYLETQINFKKILLYGGLITRIPMLIGGFFVSSPTGLIMLSFIYMFGGSIILPAQNTIFKHNYRPEVRGKLFGYAFSLQTFITMTCAFLWGNLLDYNSSTYKILLIGVGLFGSIFALFLSSIDIKDRKIGLIKKRQEGFICFVIYPFKSMFQIFKTNKKFFFFEFNYFIYGIGFMMTMPAVPFIADNILHLSKSQYSLGKATIGNIGIVLLSPLFGILLAKMKPIRFTGYGFFFVGFFPFIMFFAPELVQMFGSNTFPFYAAYIVFSIGMAGIILSWHLGSIFFAEENRENVYQSIHVTLVGVRGFFSPWLAYSFFLKNLDKINNQAQSEYLIKLNFFTSGMLFFTASALMFLLQMFIKRRYSMSELRKKASKFVNSSLNRIKNN